MSISTQADEKGLHEGSFRMALRRKKKKKMGKVQFAHRGPLPFVIYPWGGKGEAAFLRGRRNLEKKGNVTQEMPTSTPWAESRQRG